jgi:DNA (cytosine-5)-methyltransferase 1
MITFADGFCGVGGFHLGLTGGSSSSRQFQPQAGRGERNEEETSSIDGSSSTWEHQGWDKRSFNCVWANDIDKYAAQVYKKNFPETPFVSGDIRDIDADSLPDFDVWCSGFPCQSFSVAGKRRGLDEARGTLFYEIARIAERKRPRLLLLENVKGLLSHDEGRTFALILRVLGSVGYRCEWQVLNSKWFGVPQNRERVFIIGHLGEEPTRTVFPITEISGGVTEVNGEGSQTYAPTITQRVGDTTHWCPSVIRPVLTPDRPTKRQNGRRFKDDGEESFTLTGQDVHGIMEVSNSVDTSGYLREMGRHEIGKHGLTDYRIRRLTPVECERLQGFPDGWTSELSDTQRYKCMGNAVTVPVIRFLGERIRAVFTQKAHVNEVEK